MFKARWFNVELNKIQSIIFKDFLRYNSYRFEPSQCGNLTHFEIFITTEKDFNKISDFLFFLPE